MIFLSSSVSRVTCQSLLGLEASTQYMQYSIQYNTHRLTDWPTYLTHIHAIFNPESGPVPVSRHFVGNDKKVLLF